MSYVLESKNEFERLEKQSQTSGYDFCEELRDIIQNHSFDANHRILDAGCGSSIVTRYLADNYPNAQVFGCDFSDIRIRQAQEASQSYDNVLLEQANLESLHYPSNHFDLIVCRYVLQHLTPKVRENVVRELRRCLKPNGILRIIESDGLFFNIFPISEFLAQKIELWRQDQSVDMMVGRKLPSILQNCDFSEIDWNIQTINFRGETLENEIQLDIARFEQAQPLLEKIFGSREAAKQFAEEYLAAMKQPGAVMFFNKFLITAQKPSGADQKLRLVRSEGG